MYKDIIILIGLLLSFTGSVLIVFNSVLSDKKIEQLSKQYWGGSPDIKEYLLESKRKSLQGLVLLSFGLVLQIIGLIFKK